MTLNALPTSAQFTGAPAFWDMGMTGQTESLAIIDSGIDPNHPMFSGIDVQAKVFSENASSPCIVEDLNSTYDTHGHGTHVASIAAGRPVWSDLLSANVNGVAPGVRTIYAAKAGFRTSQSAGERCEDAAIFHTLDWVKAIVWIVSSTPARVINMSLGNLPDKFKVDNTTGDLLLDMITTLFPDLTLTVAAGNEGKKRLSGGTVGTPGNSYNILSVGSLDYKEKQRNYFLERGERRTL